MAYFCLYKLHEKIRSLISFATAYNSEQSTLFRCSLTRKITSLFFHMFLYYSCTGVRVIIYYHQRGSWDVKSWKTAV
jgi:hypothetical protein